MARACLQGVEGLPVHHAESLPDLRFGGLGLVELVCGVFGIHASHHLARADNLATLDENLHHALLDLGGDIGLRVRHQGSGHVQGARHAPLLGGDKGDGDRLRRLLGLGRELGLGVPTAG